MTSKTVLEIYFDNHGRIELNGSELLDNFDRHIRGKKTVAWQQPNKNMARKEYNIGA